MKNLFDLLFNNRFAYFAGGPEAAEAAESEDSNKESEEKKDEAQAEAAADTDLESAREQATKAKKKIVILDEMHIEGKVPKDATREVNFEEGAQVMAEANRDQQKAEAAKAGILGVMGSAPAPDVPFGDGEVKNALADLQTEDLGRAAEAATEAELSSEEVDEMLAKANRRSGESMSKMRSMSAALDTVLSSVDPMGLHVDQAAAAAKNRGVEGMVKLLAMANENMINDGDYEGLESFNRSVKANVDMIASAYGMGGGNIDRRTESAVQRLYRRILKKAVVPGRVA